MALNHHNNYSNKKLYLKTKSLLSDIDSLNTKNFEITQNIKKHIYINVFKAVGGTGAEKKLVDSLPPPPKTPAPDPAPAPAPDPAPDPAPAPAPAPAPDPADSTSPLNRNARILSPEEAEEYRQRLEDAQKRREYEDWAQRYFEIEANRDGLSSKEVQKRLNRHLSGQPSLSSNRPNSTQKRSSKTTGSSKKQGPLAKKLQGAFDTIKKRGLFGAAKDFLNKKRTEQEARNQAKIQSDYDAEALRNQELYEAERYNKRWRALGYEDDAINPMRDKLAKLGLLRPELVEQRSDEALDEMAKRMNARRLQEEVENRRIREAGGFTPDGVPEYIQGLTRSINSYINSRIKFYERRLDEK